MITCATPGTASSAGFITHSARSRSSNGLSLSETSPILSRSIVLEAKGDRPGVPPLAGWAATGGGGAAQLAQALGNPLPPDMHIDLVAELESDQRQAGNGFRSQ